LCLGRLVPGKGFDLALEAFALIAHRFPEARMVMASDGPERSSLEELARRRGIADRVDFIGWVAFEDISALLNASTIVLMPSRLPEGFGLVALEAALMARPVIAARAGALQEVVVDGRTGLLVDAEDHAALARAIERLLANPQEAIDLGACAQRRAREHYTWARHVEAFDALYRARARR
jgi:glycogen(starch) synthase